MIFETHAHYDDEQFEEDREELLRRLPKENIETVINVGASFAGAKNSFALAHQYPYIYAAVGVHPSNIEDLSEETMEELRTMARDKKTVAIGEIGLDYYWEKDPEKRQLQQQIFIRQLDLARQLHLPVCVHDRDAHGDTLAILKREGKGIRGVMHCFSGSWEMAQELLKLDWYIGVDGPLTFKNAAKLPEIVQKFPLERLLVETDAPYMAPVPMRGKQNEPAYVRFVAEKVAEIKGISMEMVAKQTSQNAEELYGL